MRRLLLALVLVLPATHTAGGSSFESDWLNAERSFTMLANSPLPISGEGLGARAPLARVPLSSDGRQDTIEVARTEDEPGIPSDLLAQGARWNTLTQLARIPESESDTLEFAVVGDAEPGRFIWSRVLFGKKGVYEALMKNVELRNPAFAIQLGDMVSRGIPKNYRHFFKDLNASKFSRPYLSVIGNHDRRWPHGHSDADLYEGLFGPRNYAFDNAGTRFVMLDTSQEELTAEQLAWLDRVLRTDKRKLVFTHMPPVDFKQWTLGMTGIKEGGKEFVKLMSDRKVDRVYMGHIHGYGIAQRGGVKYVLSGGGGSPLYFLPTNAPKLFYHTLSVVLAKDSIREIVHPLKGPPFEVTWPLENKDFDRLIEGDSGLVAHAH